MMIWFSTGAGWATSLTISGVDSSTFHVRLSRRADEASCCGNGRDRRIRSFRRGEQLGVEFWVHGHGGERLRLAGWDGVVAGRDGEGEDEPVYIAKV